MLIEKRKGNVFNVMWYEDDRCRGELFALEERAAMEFIEKALISANVTWSESEQPIAAQEDGPPFYLPMDNKGLVRGEKGIVGARLARFTDEGSRISFFKRFSPLHAEYEQKVSAEIAELHERMQQEEVDAAARIRRKAYEQRVGERTEQESWNRLAGLKAAGYGKTPGR